MTRLEKNSVQYTFFLIFSVIGLTWMVYLALNSEGMPVQDEIAHYNISRQAWSRPTLMLDLWGRPLNTVVYMLPSMHSWLAARLFSIILSLLGVILTVMSGARMGLKKSLFLIPVFLLFQPWYSKLGFTVLTEVPFNLFLIAGVFFWLSERYIFASLFFGSLALIRHEGIVLLGAWLIWLVIRRKWQPFLAAISPYLLFSAVYWLVFRESAFTIFFNSKPTDFYGSGSWFHFIEPVFNETGRLPFVLALLAIPAAFKLKERGLVFGLYGLYFLTHTIIFRFGLFASGGYYLFLMPLAPGIALAAALSMERFLVWLGNSAEKQEGAVLGLVTGAVSILVIILSMVGSALHVKPYPQHEEEQVLEEVAAYLQNSGVQAELVYSTHAYLNYLFEIPYENWIYMPDFSTFQPGSYVVWDQHYSDRWGVDYAWLNSPESDFDLEITFSEKIAAVFIRKP